MTKRTFSCEEAGKVFERASQVKIWLTLIVLWAAAAPAFAQTDSDTSGTGTPHGFSVSDGDTVKFGKQLIRLFGIDAPEKLQPCDDGPARLSAAERQRAYRKRKRKQGKPVVP